MSGQPFNIKIKDVLGNGHNISPCKSHIPNALLMWWRILNETKTVHGPYTTVTIADTIMTLISKIFIFFLYITVIEITHSLADYHSNLAE